MTGFGPLRTRPFRALWSAGLVSDAGDWLLFIALPVVVYNLTGSALGTSAAFLVELAPGVLLAPLAGWCADRLDRRRLLVATSALQVLALVPLLWVHTRADLPVVYGVIFAEAALLAVFDPAKNALLPALVERDQLVAANSLVGLNQNLGRLAGGPLGGLLLAVGGLRAVVFADLVTYLLAGALIAAWVPANLRTRGVPAPAAQPAPAAGQEDGQVRARPTSFLAPLRHKPIRAVLLVLLASQVAQGIFLVLFVLFVAQRLHGDAAQIGLLRGVQGIGAIAAGLALSTLAARAGAGVLTACAATVFGAVDLVVWNASWLTTSSALYIALFVVIGAPGVVLGTGLVTALQDGSADAERGRVFSLSGVAANFGQAAGMLAAGTLTGAIGLMTMLNAQAVIYLLAGALAAYTMTARQHARDRSGANVPSPSRSA